LSIQDDAPDLRAVGERLEVLLEASAVHGAVARERSEELVRLVTELYGAGLERVLEILHAAGRLDAGVLAQLADDDLVASLLLVHGLHPYDLDTRVQRALQAVRPSLRAQGVDVELLGVDAEGLVQVQLSGNVSGCSVGSLSIVVEEAVEAVAPDAAGVQVQLDAAPAGPSLIPVSALRSRLGAAPAPGIEVDHAARVVG
jgi:Fe-S cluster biogenesis protein NfuA